jgi:putative aldouronate transport system permease protein
MKKNDIPYKIFKAFNMLFMILIVAFAIIPYLHVLAKALNEGLDTMRGGLTIFPRKLTFQNFEILLKDKEIYYSLIITILRVVFGVVFGVVVQFLTAYALSRNKLKGVKFFNLFFIIPMFISGGIIPQYLLMSKIGLLNNFMVYILPALFVFYNVIVIRSYITIAIPNSLIESAYIDGAMEWRILVSIVMPLSKPILATVILWIAVGHWNDWTSTLMYVTDRNLQTLQYKLMQLIKESEKVLNLIREAAISGGTSDVASDISITPEGLVSAQVFITTIPIILVYPFVQKYFVQGVTLGAVKE